MGSFESGGRAYTCNDVKHRVYFFRWGITRDISFISSKTGSLAVATGPTAVLLEPFKGLSIVLFALFEAGRLASPSSMRRFLEAGSEEETGKRL